MSDPPGGGQEPRPAGGTAAAAGEWRATRQQRHQARELAMKAVFSRDVGLGRPLQLLDHLCEEEGAPPDVRAFARSLVAGIGERLPELDRRIAAYAENWSLPRIAAVERNVLRLGVYELLHTPDVPHSVVISEAMALADAFGGERSGQFVNGVLGQIARDQRDESAPEPPPAKR